MFKETVLRVNVVSNPGTVRSVLRQGVVYVQALVLLLFSHATLAFVDAPEVQKIVELNTAQLVSELEKHKSLYYSEPDAFYKKMEAALEDVVDFRRIAGRVMGRYARHADKNQRDQFVETFKKSLFSTYAKALVESGDFTVQVIASKMISEQNDRASVELVVTSSSGNSYPVIYSMYMNAKLEKWLLENMIVNGVNVGLAFRDRFEEEVQKYKGDLSQVIQNWHAELASSTPAN